MEYWTIPLYIAIGAYVVSYLFKNFNYFKRNGIIHLPPFPILGVLVWTTLRRFTFADMFLKLYNYNSDAKYIGFYFFTQPIVMFRDTELIKDIFVKNFEAFPNRRGFDGVDDPLFAKNLFSLKGQKWKDVRNLLSPSFTSSKMKNMYTLMSECAVDFAEFLSMVPAEKSETNIKDAFAKFTTDVIATCAFGIKVDSMRNPTNKFYVYGKEATSFVGIIRSLKLIFCVNYPKIGRLLGLKIIRECVTDFFKDIIKTTITTRDRENITRPDMIQLMMDMRGKHKDNQEMDIEDMTAQAFIFFFGGFETNSTAMSFLAHEVAANPDVQEKLRQEIDKVLEDSNGEVTYEAINRMEYLEAVINETLRLYPPVTFVERISERAYELPPAMLGEKPFILRKGQIIWAPVYGIHHDEKFFPEPKKFRPERFLDKNAYHNSPCYIPFGLGPRMCIANRFALLEIKVLLFHLLARCELMPSARTRLPMKFDRKSLFLTPEGGFWLNVQRRSNIHPALKSTVRNNDVVNS